MKFPTNILYVASLKDVRIMKAEEKERNFLRDHMNHHEPIIRG
jgi:hypothetical protein